MRTRRFVCLALGAAFAAGPPLPAAAETSRATAPASVLTAKRLVCTAVRVRVCATDGTCKPERVPSGPLVVDFSNRTYVEGSRTSPSGAIEGDRVDNGVRRFRGMASENGAPDIEFEVDASGAMKIVWLERSGTMELDARCVAG